MGAATTVASSGVTTAGCAAADSGAGDVAVAELDGGVEVPDGFDGDFDDGEQEAMVSASAPKTAAVVRMPSCMGRSNHDRGRYGSGSCRASGSGLNWCGSSTSASALSSTAASGSMSFSVRN